MSRAKRERRRVKVEVREMLERVLARLRAIFRARAADHYRLNPDARRPCHTCAFNPGTDGMRGFDSTVLGVVQAIEAGAPFFCHENLPKGSDGDWLFDPRVAQPCAAWALVKDGPDAKRAIVRGMVDDELDDARADWIGRYALNTMTIDNDRRLAPGVTKADVAAFLAGFGGQD